MFRVFFLLWNRRRALHNGSVKVKALIFFLLLLWFATSGFLFFELPGKPDLGWLDALWWAIVTMATVGYGDLFPVTSAGRYIVGVPTMVLGIGFLGYLISEIAGSLLESRSKRQRGMLDIHSHNHVIIINFNHVDTALKLVREIKHDKATQRKSICWIDETLTELPQELQDQDVMFVRGDPTREEVLRKANLPAASHVIVLVKDPSDCHSDDHNLVTTLVIERLNPSIFSVVEVINAQKIHQVEMAGANSVICATELTSSLMVQELSDPGVKDIVMDLTSDLGGSQIYFLPIQTMERWDYAELVQWGLGHHATVIGLIHEGHKQLNCPAATAIQPGDQAVVIASDRLESIDTVNPR